MLNKVLSKLIPQGAGERRSALFRLAVVSSTVSKAFALALQLIAIPLVYHALGQHRYELFLLLTAALATISLAQVGAGPGLTHGIARANAALARADESALFNAALRLTAIATLLGGGLIFAAIHLIPTDWLFGATFVGDRDEILNAARICITVLMIQILFGVVDSALAGYQEQVLTFMGSALSNVLTIGLLLLVSKNAPSVVNIILVMYGVPTLSRVLNLIILLRRRPYLLRGFFQSSRGFYLALTNVGLAFWIVQIGGLLEQHSGTYILAHLASTQATDLFAIAFKTCSLAATVVVTITQPLWPAISDAIAHRDVDWINKSYRRIRQALTIYSLALATAIILRGEWFLRHLLHIDFVDDEVLFVLLGIYFVANTWTHLFYTIMMGMSVIWKIALVALTENVLMIAFALVFVPRFGAAGMALSYLIASVVLPVWMLPKVMSRELGRLADIALREGRKAI